MTVIVIANIYSVLVTVVQIPGERITSSETKTALSSLLKDVCNVHTVTRFGKQ